MPIILPIDQRKWTTRGLLLAFYTLLVLGAATTVLPFLITVTASLSNAVDYPRLAPLPPVLFSRADRFVRGLADDFKDRPDELVFPDRPAHWTTWTAVGRDQAGADAFAAAWLDPLRDPATRARWERIAADYAAFTLDYDIADTFCNYDERDLAGFLERAYAVRDGGSRLSGAVRRERALRALGAAWGVPYRSFFDIAMRDEIVYPLHHVSWTYPRTARAADFLRYKDAYRRLEFEPGARGRWEAYWRGQGRGGPAPWPVTPAAGAAWAAFKTFVGATCPLSRTVPYALKAQWLRYFDREEVKRGLNVDANRAFGVDDYNRLFGAGYRRLADIPFPAPADAPAALRACWEGFLVRYYPRRLLELRVTPELETAYREAVRQTFRTVENYNWLLKTHHARFEDIALPTRLPPDETANLWIDFVKRVPVARLVPHSAEDSYQRSLLARYGSLAGVNAAYGWNLRTIEEAGLPIAQAYAVTFLHNEWRHTLYGMSGNFRYVIDYLFIRGRAFVNTIILVVLTLVATLTVNPMAAYALSRFHLRWTEQILLFLMATMAFPAAVSAIPGFLLMRDLHLLNTYAALVLPGLASGMAIFILKGFFDGIPRELYEAATIDGASEWQMFLRVTLPMTTPILAVNSLNAFIAAYGSWEWALLVCQRQDHWTLSVWLYQLSRHLGTPWIMMAGFVFASIPTAIVFIACQKIILRGVVLPSMK